MFKKEDIISFTRIDFIVVNLLREGVNVEDANVASETEVAKGCV